MTVSEFIEYLKTMDKDLIVCRYIPEYNQEKGGVCYATIETSQPLRGIWYENDDGKNEYGNIVTIY